MDVAQIPFHATAVAGYVNGVYQTYDKLVVRFPHAHLLSIDVNGSENADCLDVEKGDATNQVAPVWVRRQLAKGGLRPVVYTSLSNAQQLVGTLAAAGIVRSQYRLWTAHYTFKPHLCSARCGFGPVRADATQWTDRALGRNLDQSLLRRGFWA